MFQDQGMDSNSISAFGEAGFLRNRDTEARETMNVTSPTQAQISSPKNLPKSAFKVYDRVLEKHRYIPRKWTQEEFEAALPERFKDKTTVSNCNSEVVRQKTPEFDIVNTANEFEFRKEKDELLTSKENVWRQPCSNLQKKAERKEKIKNLKAIFENAGNSNVHGETHENLDQFDDFQVEYNHGTSGIDENEIEELERCKDSEAKVKVHEEEYSSEIPQKVDKNSGIVNEDLEGQISKICPNGFSSFLNASLRCLLNIKPFVEILSNSTSAPENNASPNIIVKLNQLISSTENAEEFSKFVSEDLFSELYERISECKRCDEVLEIFLETLIHEIQQNTGDDQDTFRSLIQGAFSHIKSCNLCESILNETEPFLFLNPTIPVVNSSNNSLMDVDFLSCVAEGVWNISTKQLCVKPRMTVIALKNELLRCHEFYTSDCDLGSIQIGEVNGSRLVKTFKDEDELSTIKIRPTSRLFAFHLLDFQSDVSQSYNSLSSTAISYHLHFNCGLCLGDGKEVGLFIHKNCGGMVCRDCLDVITQSYQDWELCPCPICERPIDLDKELCKATMSAAVPKESHPISKHLCEVIFRAERPVDEGSELFGYPLLVSLPQRVTGNHLYRSIGYLLPNALPMKDRTSFTLHTVNKSGLRCSKCAQNSCHGCLIRIDDIVTITPETTLVVHFDDLAEETKKSFGIRDPQIIPASNSKGLFDGILQSCVRASTSESTCSNCHTACKVASSIAEFPQLLLIHLNRLYADTGLPPDTTIADVSRFLVLQNGKDSSQNTQENLTYQLTAVVLADECSVTPFYKTYVPRRGQDTWMLHEELQISEASPSKLQLTKNSVLFYQPLKIPSSDLPEVGYVLRHDKKLATISKETATTSYPKHTTDLKRSARKQRSSRTRQKDRLEPGECFVGTGLYAPTHLSLLKRDVHSSQLSLGEISHNDIAAHMAVELDGISPISAQEIWKSDSRLVKETKKLIRAVKREDAYGIVCSLKRGANPCLLVNDVSALHLTAGTKSDQRSSMLAYLLKYAKDVNIATGDGTTPMHVAAAWGHQDALELLLTHGGDAFNITDQEGNSAFDLASKDCSSFLQLLSRSDGNLPGPSEPSTSSRKSLSNRAGIRKARRLEDVVRSNVTLPSFVHEEDRSRSRFRLRFLKPFRSLRNKSSGVLRSLKRMSSVRRRFRIGVMVAETQKQNNSEEL